MRDTEVEPEYLWYLLGDASVPHTNSLHGYIVFLTHNVVKIIEYSGCTERILKKI